MTGYQSKKKAASAKTIDEVNWADHEPDGLAQPAQEPVGTVQRINGITIGYLEIKQPVGTKLYTTPPQRTWVGLTPEDLKPICDEWRIVYGAWMIDFARDIEAKLKEKNT
jgi:uncharacterized protein (DUF2237 family)